MKVVNVEDLLAEAGLGAASSAAKPGAPAAPVKTAERREFPQDSEPALRAFKAALDRHGPALCDPAKGISGGGKHTVQVGCIAHEYGLEMEGKAWELVKAWGLTCQTPWEDEDELRAFVLRGYACAQSPYGNKRDFLFLERSPQAAKNENAEPGSYEFNLKRAHEAFAQTSNGPQGERSKRFAFERATELLSRAVAALVWFIVGLVPEKSVLVIAGEPKTSKTWLALTMALAISARKTLFGEFKVQENERRSVAYFALEDSEGSFRTRLAAIARGMDLDPAKALEHVHVKCRGGLNLLNDDDLCGLLAAAWMLPPLALLVIDPLRDAHTAEENSSGEMAEVMRRLRFLRDTLGCSVLFIHHSAKASQDKAGRRPGQLMRGSSAVHGAVDGGIYMSLQSSSEVQCVSTAVVELKAGKGAGTFGLTLDIADDANGEAHKARWTFSREVSRKGKDELENNVAALVEALERHFEHSAKGMSGEAIRTVLGIGTAQKGALIREALKRGVISSAGYNKGYILTAQRGQKGC